MTYRLERVYIVFVYGADFPRGQVDNVSCFWAGVTFWILSATFIVSTIFLHHLRHVAQYQSVDFMTGDLGMFPLVSSGEHSMKNRCYAVALITSFFAVSIYLANFLLHVPQKVNTFEELANRNVTFHMSTLMTEHKENIAQLLR